MGILLYYDDAMLDHDPGPGHPERADRLRAIRARLLESAIAGIEWRVPRRAARGEVARVHASEYVDLIERCRGQCARLDADTPVSAGSTVAAFLAAGAAVEAVDALLAGAAHRAFLFVRPPGHHAERERAMGFCLFNNVAIGAAHAIAAHGLSRILIVDWDVHHGNGTQHAFESRSDVLVVNSHQYPFWPGSGALAEIGSGAGTGFTVNLPLPAGFGDEEYAAVYAEIVAPIARAYRPELIFVSAGFDPHRDDPLAGMRMTACGFAHLARVVSDLASELCGGRIIFCLEGGYDLSALAESVLAVVSVAAGCVPPEPPAPALPAGRPYIDSLARFHSRTWPAILR